MSDKQLDELVAAVMASAKYGAISENVIRSIGARELAVRRNLKEAVKATRNKLHQVAGVYSETKPDYATSLHLLRESVGDADQLRNACRMIMVRHASTRERLPILDHFYDETLAGIGPIHSVIDIGCGLNPLAIPWMGLAAGARYLACDIYIDLADFLGSAIPLMGVTGEAIVCDVTHALPDHKADLALLLKSIPCLEQIDKSAGMRLLEGLRARQVLVSFPARSLGGHQKGMVENYEAHFMALVGDRGWQIKRFAFENELVFLMTKGEPERG